MIILLFKGGIFGWWIYYNYLLVEVMRFLWGIMGFLLNVLRLFDLLILGFGFYRVLVIMYLLKIFLFF